MRISIIPKIDIISPHKWGQFVREKSPSFIVKIHTTWVGRFTSRQGSLASLPRSRLRASTWTIVTPPRVGSHRWAHTAGLLRPTGAQARLVRAGAGQGDPGARGCWRWYDDIASSSGDGCGTAKENEFQRNDSSARSVWWPCVGVGRIRTVAHSAVRTGRKPHFPQQSKGSA